MQFPSKLVDVTGSPREWVGDNVGCSDSHVAFIPRLGAWIKYGKDGIRAERDGYLYLSNKVLVPRVLFYQECDEYQYLVVSSLPGVSLIDSQLLARPEELVTTLAGALRTLHALDIKGCPLHGGIDKYLSEWQYPLEDYQWLVSNRPPEDVVFTHGDACLPNFIQDEKGKVGYVDLGFAGVADRWQDLALALWSLSFNLKTPALGKRFLAAYGCELDRRKLEYYLRLNMMEDIEVLS